MYKQMSLKLDEALYNQIDKLSNETGANKNEIVRHALRQYFLRRDRAVARRNKQQA